MVKYFIAITKIHTYNFQNIQIHKKTVEHNTEKFKHFFAKYQESEISEMGIFFIPNQDFMYSCEEESVYHKQFPFSLFLIAV